MSWGRVFWAGQVRAHSGRGGTRGDLAVVKGRHQHRPRPPSKVISYVLESISGTLAAG